MNRAAEAGQGDSTPLRFEVVDDLAGFEQLEPVWRRLEGFAPARSPCQRWDWARLWWRHYGRAEDRLWIVVVRAGDEIVGLCPLYLRDAHRNRGRRLRFLATGEPEDCEVASEFLDVLALPTHRAGVGRAAIDAISTAPYWREVELRNVLESSTMADNWDHPALVERARIERGLRYTLRLDPSWEAYLGRLAPRFRTRVRGQVRAYEQGQQELIEAEPDECSSVFDLMAELHRRHWESRGRAGAFATSVFRDFHRDLIGTWSDRREALLRVLRRGADVLGVLYNFRWRGLEAYYQSGFVLGHRDLPSPGLACHIGAIRQARAEGLDAYDFMLGRADSYKAHYGCDATRVVDLACDRRGAVARAVDRGFTLLARN
jgi:CelD/BcsL family acetyltransferase involved in cellulose biosynthesis